ncbi:hypothetical protein AGLY_005093 [Aphis glycines]|uniref:Uncharacterized protein n=1 Tax=Aphis glycines TaxID=307491 RepID=A0A6G0TVW9_APHGL|nr:hypothetical protein AGLY_005093 [Aphis glycines]
MYIEVRYILFVKHEFSIHNVVLFISIILFFFLNIIKFGKEYTTLLFWFSTGVVTNVYLNYFMLTSAGTFVRNNSSNIKYISFNLIQNTFKSLSKSSRNLIRVLKFFKSVLDLILASSAQKSYFYKNIRFSEVINALIDFNAGVTTSVLHTSSAYVILPKDKYSSRKRFTEFVFVDTEDTNASFNLVMSIDKKE